MPACGWQPIKLTCFPLELATPLPGPSSTPFSGWKENYSKTSEMRRYFENDRGKHRRAYAERDLREGKHTFAKATMKLSNRDAAGSKEALFPPCEPSQTATMLAREGKMDSWIRIAFYLAWGVKKWKDSIGRGSILGDESFSSNMAGYTTLDKRKGSLDFD